MVRHLVHAVVRDVAHPHAPSCRRRDVDVIEPDARRRDDAKARQLRELVGGDGLEGEEADDVLTRPRRRARLDDDVEAVEVGLHLLTPERLIREDARHATAARKVEQTSRSSTPNRSMRSAGPTVTRTKPGSP